MYVEIRWINSLELFLFYSTTQIKMAEICRKGEIDMNDKSILASRSNSGDIGHRDVPLTSFSQSLDENERGIKFILPLDSSHSHSHDHAKGTPERRHDHSLHKQVSTSQRRGSSLETDRVNSSSDQEVPSSFVLPEEGTPAAEALAGNWSVCFWMWFFYFCSFRFFCGRFLCPFF